MNSRTLGRIESRSRRSESGSTRKAIFLRNNVIKVPNLSQKDTQFMGEEILFSAARGLTLNELKFWDSKFDNILNQFFTEWRIWICCPENLRHLLAPIRQFGFTEKGVPYTIMKKMEVFTEEEVDDFDCTYGCCSIDYLGEILCDDYDVQVWDNFGSDVVSLCNKFGLGIADFDSNPGNLGFEYEGEAEIKRVRFVDYGFKTHGGKDDRWNPVISKLISA